MRIKACTLRSGGQDLRASASERRFHSRLRNGVMIIAWLLGSPHEGTSQVYSMNVVGYTDTTMAAGSNLVSSPFHAEQNIISKVLKGLPGGSYYVRWDRATHAFVSTNFFDEATGWSNPEASLTPVDVGFLWVPRATNITFTGEAPMGKSCIVYPAGESYVSALPDEVCECFVGPCPPPYPDGTIVQRWNAVLQDWDPQPYVYSAELGWFHNETPEAPALSPAEGAKLWAPTTFSGLIPGVMGAGIHRLVALRDCALERTNLSFRFQPYGDTNWSVLRTTNLQSADWELVDRSAVSVGPKGISIAVGPDRQAYYRLLPFAGNYPVILPNLSRAGAQFTFQFYASPAGVVDVQRTTSFNAGAQWVTVHTVNPGKKMVTFTDTQATASKAYYRLLLRN